VRHHAPRTIGKISLVLAARIFAQYREQAIFAGLRQAQPYRFLVGLGLALLRMKGRNIGA
jgi:hypothetical protein